MSERINYMKQSPELFKKLVELAQAAHVGTIEPAINELIALRASQINGCGFCVDMHVKQAHLLGERELRLHHVATWRESSLFSPRERACLAWTEFLTRLPDGGVPDDVYERVRTQLNEQEIVDLTYLVMLINAWNRANVAFHIPPGAWDKTFGLDKAKLK
jgi:AhpD family alkylhydroperoxidase